MDMIFYILGGCLQNSEWKKENGICTDVYAEVELNNQLYTLKREISEKKDNFQIPMFIFNGSLKDGLKNLIQWKKYPYNQSKEKDSFSNVLFKILEIPEVKILSIDHAITMNSCLRLMYYDQRTPYFEIFRNETYDNELKRNVISDLLCGVYSTGYYSLEKKLKEKNIEFDRVSQYLSNITLLLSKDKNILDADAMQILVDTKKEDLEQKNNEYKEQQKDFYSNQTLNKNSNKNYNKLVEDIRKVNSEMELCNTRLLKLKYESNDSQLFIYSLEKKLESMSLSKETQSFLDDIENVICPICYSKIKPIEDNNRCYLCTSEVSNINKLFNIDRLERNLLTQIKESESIESDRLSDITLEEKKLKKNKSLKSQLQNQLTMYTNTISKNEIYFLKKSQEIAYLQKDIEVLDEKLAISYELQEKVKHKKKLKLEITDLEIEIESIKNLNISKLQEVQKSLDTNIIKLLQDDIGKDKELQNIKNVEINFEKNKLYINENISYAASTMGYIKNCFALSLWQSSIQKNSFNLPRFMLLDNIEDKGLTSNRIHHFQRTIKQIVDENDVDCQIIISASKLDETLKNKEYMIGASYCNVDNKRTLQFLSTKTLNDI